MHDKFGKNDIMKYEMLEIIETFVLNNLIFSNDEINNINEMHVR